MTHPVHVLRDAVGITEVLGRCRQGSFCHLEHATKTDAVREVRDRVYKAQKKTCFLCGIPVDWETGQLHEMHHRGKGGHFSISNSIFICEPCHKNEHKDRNPQWSKKVKT